MVGLVRCLVGGLIGAAIGGAIWVAVGYFTQYEVGWIAWGIGAIVGLGVRIGGQETDGLAPGALAVLIAVLAIVASKYLVVSMLVDREIPIASFSVEADGEMMISREADKIVEEYETAKKKVKWPKDAEDDDTPLPERYPKEIWKEATKRWNAVPPEEQKIQMEQAEAEFNEMFGELIEKVKAETKRSAFQESFSPFDILWFVLAAMTAFRLGSGLTTDE